MARRSKAMMRPGRQRLSPHPLSHTACLGTTSQDDMNDPKGSPPRGGPSEATNLADTRQKSERNKKIWMTDLFERIVEVEVDIDKFLEKFVPSSVDTPPSVDAPPSIDAPRRKRGKSKRKPKPVGAPKCEDKNFTGIVPRGKGKESGMYGPLIDGLTHLVDNFPESHRPTFHNCANTELNPPYELCDIVEHRTKQDIVVTVPSLPSLDPLLRWRNLALVFEVKGEECDDPMKKYLDKHEETIIQLAKSARNLMLAQGRLFAFCVGIYGHTARIFRFDRAGGVCSPLFNYITDPQYLHGFLWRFVHPINEGCAVVGDDPTTSLGTEADRSNVERHAKEMNASYKEDSNTIRRFIVTDDRIVADEPRKKEKTYLAYKMIFVNNRLCSRASMLWEAFELDDAGQPTGPPVVIKEGWRLFRRPSEITHYQDLQEAADSAAEDAAVFLSGFAELECGDDLGLRETKTLAEAGHAVTSDKKPLPRPAAAAMDESQLLQLAFDPAVVFGHRTVSACCREAPPDFERGQIRMVIKTVGTPITDFKSTYEMVGCLYDAIAAHKRAYQAGIIHRDVSRGNVMFRRKANGVARGFLHDFDHASSWKRFLADIQSGDSLAAWEAYTWEEYKKDVAAFNTVLGDSTKGADLDYDADERVDLDRSGSGAAQPQETPSVQEELQDAPRAPSSPADAPPTPGDPPHTPREPKDAPHSPAKSKEEQRKEEQKQRTGTIHFMAIEILSKGFRVTHEARHDLESFYWLLVWIVLRHVKCDVKYRTWHRLFDCANSEAAVDIKMAWLTGDTERITINANRPLTSLLERFRLLCQKNSNIKQSEARMTHDKVLHLFAVSLRNRSVWPQNDGAIPWTMPATEPSDHPQPDGRTRTTGTIAFSIPTQEEAVTGVAPDDALRTSRARRAVPDTGDPREEAQTGPEPDGDIEVGPIKKGKRPARKTVARLPPARPVTRTMSQASGSHNAPPSSDDASAAQGSNPPRLRKQKGLPPRLASSAPRMGPPPMRAMRSMGPPPVPVTRSMDPPQRRRRVAWSHQRR
ncbi:hypothetical protein C8Q72DRAFT_971638 [Fomitopsis betulina]|nr:hypothetical protein C8Q72DRAFT_971638 [Fomitopsis betulina]